MELMAVKAPHIDLDLVFLLIVTFINSILGPCAVSAALISCAVCKGSGVCLV